MKTLTITAHTQGWFKETKNGRVLHLFDNACNFSNEAGNILSLVTPNIRPGPFSIVVSSSGLKNSETFRFTNFISADSPVKVIGQRLTAGRLGIDTLRAYVWQPRPAWERIDPGSIRFLLPVMRCLIEGRTVIDFSENEQSSKNPDIFLQLFYSGWNLLSDGLKENRYLACAEGAKRLAGIGPGLTPAGDDFLMGVLYGLWLTKSPKIAKKLANTIVNAATPHTTELSSAWLKSAGRGDAGADWHDLIDSLFINDKSTMASAIGRILQTGHTSGADALAGFVASLILLVNQSMMSPD